MCPRGCVVCLMETHWGWEDPCVRPTLPALITRPGRYVSGPVLCRAAHQPLPAPRVWRQALTHPYPGHFGDRVAGPVPRPVPLPCRAGRNTRSRGVDGLHVMGEGMTGSVSGCPGVGGPWPPRALPPPVPAPATATRHRYPGPGTNTPPETCQHAPCLFKSP